MIELALPISVSSLLSGSSVEWERLEFKAGWNPEDILHTMCAFANDVHNMGGGYIIVGVQECDGKPVLPPCGISADKLDSYQKRLCEFGYNCIIPQYHPIAVPYEIDGKLILVIWVPGGELRPYKAKRTLANSTANDYCYYVRRGSLTTRAFGEAERELMGLVANVPFDDRYNQSATLQDLSVNLIAEFLREVKSGLQDQIAGLDTATIGRQMNIVGGAREATFPKNVGLLFFNNNPDSFFPQAQIDVVFMPDGPGGDMLSEKLFKGPLHKITQEALSYIKTNFIRVTILKSKDRAEAERFYNFPYAAVEEALVNAVYHRSYEIREPVGVRITFSELSVLSFPGPDRSIRIDDLCQGRAVSRRYRNRRIGEFLKELNLAEGRATGIPKILRAMGENGSPAPIFETDEERTSFLIRLPVRKGTVMVDAYTKEGGVWGGGQEGTKSSTKLALSAEQEKILSALKNPEPIKSLMAVLNRKDRTKFKSSVINPLLEAGLIEMTIPDKPRSSQQRYRLTDNGEMYLQG